MCLAALKKHLLSTRYSVYLLFRKGNARKENPASSLLISFRLWSLVVWVRILLRTLNIEPEPGITFTITTRGHLGSSTSAVKKWVRNGKRVAVEVQFRQSSRQTHHCFRIVTGEWKLSRCTLRAIKQNIMSKYGREYLRLDCDHDFAESNMIYHLFKVYHFLWYDMKSDEPSDLYFNSFYLCVTAVN